MDQSIFGRVSTRQRCLQMFCCFCLSTRLQIRCLRLFTCCSVSRKLERASEIFLVWRVISRWVSSSLETLETNRINLIYTHGNRYLRPNQLIKRVSFIWYTHTNLGKPGMFGSVPVLPFSFIFILWINLLYNKTRPYCDKLKSLILRLIHWDTKPISE